MKVKLTREVLVTSIHQTQPQVKGTVVDLSKADAKHYIDNGLAEDFGGQNGDEGNAAATTAAQTQSNGSGAETASGESDEKAAPAHANKVRQPAANKSK